MTDHNRDIYTRRELLHARRVSFWDGFAIGCVVGVGMLVTVSWIVLWLIGVNLD